MDRSRGSERKGWRKGTLVFLCSFLVGALTSVGVSAALAVDSATGYYTVAGTQYQNYASIGTVTSGSGTASAQTVTQKSASCTPSGYAGSKGRLFNGSTGALVFEDSVFRYNSSSSCIAISGVVQSGHRVNYSYGVSQAWNGSGYTAFYTYQTVNQNS